eukprot:XP_003242381.1 PREDICTED: uncharacterized protein LOC100574616 [Acyrthosiphon pisum]
MVSKINIQFEEIRRLEAEKYDKTEFIEQQMKIASEKDIYKKTTLFSKRLEREKEDEYYKFFCKTLMIDDLLYNKYNATNAKKLVEKNKTLTEKCHSSKKEVKTVLNEVELFKYHFVSYFDDTYDNVDKTEIIKIIMLTFNQIITIGYMCYWKSNAEILKKNAELWTVHNPCGMPIHFNMPFNQTI